MEEKTVTPAKKIRPSGTSVAALSLVLAGALSLGLTYIDIYAARGTILLLFWISGTVFLPIVGAVVGIAALCCDVPAYRKTKEPAYRQGIIISIIAIALPVAAVLVLVLLLKTGVAVISLM